MFFSFANKYLCLLLFVYYFVYLFMAFLPLHPRALGIAIIMHWEFIICLCLNCVEKGKSHSFRASKPNVKSRLQRRIKQAKLGANNEKPTIINLLTPDNHQELHQTICQHLTTDNRKNYDNLLFGAAWILSRHSHEPPLDQPLSRA